MNAAEKILRLTEELTYQQNRAEAAEAMVELRDAQIAVLRRTLRETRAEQDFAAEVYAHDEFWNRVQAVEG
jgi:predicted ATPase